MRSAMRRISATAAVWLCAAATTAAAAEPLSQRVAAERLMAEGAKLRCLIGAPKQERIGPVVTTPGQLPEPVRVVECDLRDTGLTDDDLALVSRFVELRKLELLDLPIGRAGLKHLAPLKNLHILDLRGTRIDDDTLAELAPFRKLQNVHLARTALTDSGLERLTAFPEMRLLNIGVTKTTDAGMAHLKTFAKLEILNIEATGVTDEGLTNILALRRLTAVSLHNTAITAAGAKRLAALPQLTSLNLVNTFVAESDVAELKKVLPPTCKIQWAADRVRRGTPPVKRPPPESVALPASVELARPDDYLSVKADSYCTTPLRSFLRGGTLLVRKPKGSSAAVPAATKPDGDAGANADGKVDKGAAPTTELIARRDLSLFIITPGNVQRDEGVLVGVVQFPGDADNRRLYWQPCQKGEAVNVSDDVGFIVPPQLDVDPLPLVPEETDGRNVAYAVMFAKTRYWLTGGKYDELEAEIAKIRREKKKVGTGTWFLSLFYQSFDMDNVPREAWPELLSRLESWARAKPNSVAPQIALVSYWIDYGWDARGGGYADTVTPEGARLFDERLRRADEIATRAETLAEKDAYLCRVQATMARALGKTPEDLEAIVSRSLEIEPTYGGIFDTAAEYYMPRWFGRPGDLERFAAASADRTKSSLGDAEYARIVWAQARYFREDIFEVHQFDWERTKRGYADLARQLRHAYVAYEQLAILAGEHGDAETCRRALDQVRELAPRPDYGEAYLSVWRRWSAPDRLEGAQRQTIDALRKPYRGLDLSVDDKYFVTGSWDGEVALFHVGETSPNRRFDTRLESPIFFALVPFERTVVTADAEGELAAIDLTTGEVARFGAKDSLFEAALSSDGAELATTSRDGSVRFWNLETRELADEWSLKPALASNVAYVPGTPLVALGETRGRVRLWNRETHEPAGELPAQGRIVRALRVSPNGKFLAVLAGNQVTLWRLPSLEPAGELPATKHWVQDVAFSADATKLAAGTGVDTPTPIGEVVVWDVASRAVLQRLPGHKGRVESVRFTRDGRTLISAGSDMTVRLWDVPQR